MPPPWHPNLTEWSKVRVAQLHSGASRSLASDGDQEDAPTQRQIVSLGSEVARGRWGRSLSCGGLSKPLTAGGGCTGVLYG